MEEQKVNIEEAIRLKKLGFDWVCDEVYNTEHSKNPTAIKYDLHGSGFNNSENEANTYSAPTVSLALKWVRDTHQIYIRPYRQWIDVHRPDNKYGFEIDDLNNKDVHKNHESWEAAESRGLTLALNRIENRQ